MHADLPRFVEACTYPGHLDESAVRKHLALLLDILGHKRRIVRLGRDWTFEKHPSLLQSVNAVLDEFKPAIAELATSEARAARTHRVARNALAALDKGHAREALTDFAFCVANDAWGDYFADDETVLSDVRRALVVLGAPFMTTDELDAIATEGIWRSQKVHAYPVMNAAYTGVQALMFARHTDQARASFPDRIGNLITPTRYASLARTEPTWGSSVIDADNARFKRDAEDAISASMAFPGVQAAREAMNARNEGNPVATEEALRSFTAWCIEACGSQYSDLSLVTMKWFKEPTNRNNAFVRPLLEAFIAGAWTIYWTPDTLFWVAKPTLRRDANRRLHCDDGPAFESDLHNLHFWHGVCVPAFVVTQPERITIDQIQGEENLEVRRILIERYGSSRFLVDSRAEILDRDTFGTLYYAPMQGDEPLVMVRVVNSTPEPDGSHREYILRVPPTMKRAREAVAWTFGLRELEYDPKVET